MGVNIDLNRGGNIGLIMGVKTKQSNLKLPKSVLFQIILKILCLKVAWPPLL
jgi:hypothetical protein